MSSSSSSSDNQSNGKDKATVSYFEQITQWYDAGIATKNECIKQMNDAINKTSQTLDKFSPDKVKQQLMATSIYLNHHYPYMTMLCRSHDQEIKFFTTAAVAYQTRKLGRRLFVFSTISAYLFSSSTIYLAQYKWLSETAVEKK